MFWKSHLWLKSMVVLLLLGALLLLNNALRAEDQTVAATLQFSGYTWEVRPAGFGGPGGNQWDPNGVWVDPNGDLHLKLRNVNGQWRAAELYTTQRLGFGTYQWQIIGPIDKLDRNLVLGLFNYTRPDVGPDGTNEIDIEFARWGNASAPNLNYVVWPALSGTPKNFQTHNFTLSGTYTTHRFTWSANSILFQSLHGHTDTDSNEFYRWSFAPAQPSRDIPQKPLPLHMNLWLFDANEDGIADAPVDGVEMEIVIRKFTFIPADGTTPTPTPTPTPTATPTPGTIAAPSNLSAATVSDVQIDLAWTDNSTNEGGFKIERCQGVNCTTFAQVATRGANVRSFANTGLVADTTYCYRVRAYAGTQNSVYSNSVCRTTGPMPPTTLTHNRLLATEVNLFWVESSTNENGFKLERCTGGTCTNFAQIALLPPNGIGYHDSGLSAATAYRYRVAAYTANGNSRYSAIRTITTLAATAAAQENIVAEPVSEITLQSWQYSQAPLVIAHRAACVNGAPPTQVTLQAGPFTFPMSVVADQQQHYQATIADTAHFAADTDYLLAVAWQCADSVTPLHEYIGLLQSAPDSTAPPEGATHLYLPVIAHR